MNKTTLYFIFIGFIFSNSQTYARVSFMDAKIKVAIHKEHNENNAICDVSKRDPFSHNADLLIYLDDNEEYDTENNTFSLKEKHSCSIISFISHNQSVYATAKPFCANSYSCHNFSRLPRFTHISLRVLLI